MYSTFHNSLPFSSVNVNVDGLTAVSRDFFTSVLKLTGIYLSWRLFIVLINVNDILDMCWRGWNLLREELESVHVCESVCLSNECV